MVGILVIMAIVFAFACILLGGLIWVELGRIASALEQISIRLGNSRL